MRLLAPIAVSCTALAFAAPSSADTIHLTTGDTLSNVSVESESLEGIEYEKDRKKGTVAADQVLRVEYSSMPPLVDRAEAALIDDQLLTAVGDLEQYLMETSEKADRRFPWARDYALYRVVDLNATMGEFDEVIRTADRFIAESPASRYLPYAHLEKIEALYFSDEAAKAETASRAFSTLISSKSLGGRWELENEVRGVLFGKLTDAQRSEKLESISSRAGTRYPTVRNMADVALAESLLLSGDVAGAEKMFKAVTSDPKADERTLAGAWSGLGDCIYRRATEKKDSGKDATKDLRSALKAYMRVVVVYEFEFRYVPHAMLYAGRAFDALGDEESQERAQRLYRQILVSYSGSREANEAKAFRRK